MISKNKIKKIRLGIMPWAIDSLMLPFSSYEDFELVCLVAKDTIEEKWVNSFFEKDKILFYNLDKWKECLGKHGVKNILKYSNIAEIIKKNKINYLWFLTREIDYLANWNKKNDHKIIIVNSVLSKNLENKIWFDKFMKDHKLPKPKSEVGNPYKSEIKLKGSLVVQRARSTGGAGTFFIDNKRDFKKLIYENKIKKNEKCLIREKIEGKAYAITIFVSSENISLSAIRQQCVSKNLFENRSQFLGIQWIPSNNISLNVRKEINGVFEKMGKLLYDHKFFGLTSFDFIIDNNRRVYILECNPRLTGATAQLIKFPELISNIDTAGTFISEFIKSGFCVKEFCFNPLPNTLFDGSVVNIDFNFDILKTPLLINKEYRNGVYKVENEKIKFKTPDIRKFNDKEKQLVFVSVAKKGDIYNSDELIATIISNYRLYDSNGYINKEGKKLLELFKY